MRLALSVEHDGRYAGRSAQSKSSQSYYTAMRILYISIITLVLPGVMGLASPCGDPDDSCMNNENWKQCRNLEVNGCKSIQVLESCPLQFACGDGNDEKLYQISENAIDGLLPFVIPSEDISGERMPGACVSLFVYQNSKCSGPPLRVLSFPTWTAPGSACIHDGTMHHRSAKDQYCNLSTGNWHETVIVGSSTCHPPHWWEGGKKYDLTFTIDSCIGGVRLKSCTQGPCNSQEMDPEALEVLNSLSLAKL
jgi:hypothetical protein